MSQMLPRARGLRDRNAGFWLRTRAMLIKEFIQ
jgi:hypothetical protein